MMTTKSNLQRWIQTYLERRDKLRKKHKQWNKSNPEYQKAAKPLNRKINNWRKRIKRIDEKQVIVREASKLVCDFMRIPRLNLTVNITNKHTVLAKQLFSAYVCPKLGYRWQFVASEFLGNESKNHWNYAPVLRKKFLRSIKSDKTKSKLWNDFKKFVKYHADHN